MPRAEPEATLSASTDRQILESVLPRKEAWCVRGGADGKGLGNQHLAGGLLYNTGPTYRSRRAALPAVDYPMDGGLSWGELEVITGAALAASGVLGWDITIYNPDLDPTRAHAERITAYIVGSLARCGT